MDDQSDRDPPPQDQRPPRLLSRGQFSIGSLLLITLWIAICLGMYRLSPMIGGSVGVWTVPAVIRSLVAIQIWRRRLQSLSWGDVYEIFGHSLMLVAAAELSAVFAFGIVLAVCMLVADAAGLPLNAAGAAATAIATISGIGVASWVLWLGRPSRLERPA